MQNKYPNIAVDVVLFSYLEKTLNVLLIQRNVMPFLGEYALPGVFLKEDEKAEEAALRALKDETNVQINYLEQLYTFTSSARDPRQRIISVSYFGLINPNLQILSEGNKDASLVKWVNCDIMNSRGDGNFLPVKLAFDHDEIYKMAFNRLQTKVQYEPIGFGLLPDWFTLGELYKLYSTILQKEFDRRNFTRKVMSYGLIKKTEHKSTGNVGRKGQLYEFDLEQYTKLKQSGFYFEI